MTAHNKQITNLGDIFGPLVLFGPTVLNVNGVTLTIDADAQSGEVIITTDANIKAHSTNKSVAGYVANGTVQQICSIGDVLPDGWIVGPVSPETGIIMSIEPTAGALPGCQWGSQADVRGNKLRDRGNRNARLVTHAELFAIYNDVVKAGRNDNAQLDITPGTKYWTRTRTEHSDEHWVILSLADGEKSAGYCFSPHALVRCVRDEPTLKLV